ncbi:hypothetical protein [Natrinema altunense]|uniref:Uncharacterized protein n=2 Tax=Natrinema altunense TaxID=222984 RepID=L9ZI61_NATA2|nr:hypothetical protein [Natrinema altunense]ELY86019.1 hypothetical protein C485_12478 [Natrinema altunense JCM 12890]RZH69371.1 hypothetical protein ELS17_08095 [Natrinema altunense]
MVPMTSSTANTSDRGLLDTRFSIGAAAIAAVAALLGVAFAWTGYNGGMLPVLGLELSILTGMIGLLFGFGIATVAFVAAVYMEPGFDQ